MLTAFFRSKILIDMGEGLLSRLYFYIRKLKTNDKAPVLVSKEFSRVRTKAEKSFPEIPEFTKVC